MRVLDGVGADGLALHAARDVVGAGGQVVVVGNADRFDAAVTRVVYFDEGAGTRGRGDRRCAGGHRTSAGPARTPTTGSTSSVVAGADLAAAYGLSARPTTTGDDAG